MYDFGRLMSFSWAVERKTDDRCEDMDWVLVTRA